MFSAIKIFAFLFILLCGLFPADAQEIPSNQTEQIQSK